MKRALLLVALLLAAIPAWATNYYVSTTGSDANMCTIGFKCLTPAHVVPLMAPGDDLIISGGDYRTMAIQNDGTNCPSCVDGTNSTEGSGAITVKAATGETVQFGFVWAARSYWLYDNINIDGQDGSQFAADGLHLTATHVEFRYGEVTRPLDDCMSSESFGDGNVTANHIHHNHFHDCGNHDSSIGHVPHHCWYHNGGEQDIIEYNEFDNCRDSSDANGAYCIQYFSGGGEGWRSAHNTFRSNYLHNCTLGMFIGASAHDNLFYNNVFAGNIFQGIILATGENNQIYNNTWYGNGGHGMEAFSCTSPLIKNNIAYGNGGSDIMFRADVPCSGAILTDNLTGNCIADEGANCLSSGAVVTLSGNNSGNPHFTDPASSDFSLTALSTLAIANAVDLSATFTDDFLGATRASGAFDRGAYAYSVSGCIPDHLAFITQPSNAQQGVSVGLLQVGVYDAGGSLCTSDTSTVTLSKHSGTCTGMALDGTVSSAAAAGVFGSSDVNMDAATGSCELDASDGMLTGATSDPFTVSAPAVGTGGGSRLRLRKQ